MAKERGNIFTKFVVAAACSFRTEQFCSTERLRLPIVADKGIKLTDNTKKEKSRKDVLGFNSF